MCMIVDKCDKVQTSRLQSSLKQQANSHYHSSFCLAGSYIKHQGKSSEEQPCSGLVFQSYAPCYYNICSLNFPKLYLARIDGSTC